MRKLTRTILLAASLFAGLLAASPAARAGSFTFHLTLNTAALNGAPNSPFLLDFQLNYGGGNSVANTVTLSNFSFVGGSPTPNTISTFGNATGSLANTVTLGDSSASPFNEFYQGFAAGTTSISFDVTTTQFAAGVTPDQFAAAILDSSSGNPQIATNAPDGVSLATLNIGSTNTLAGSVLTYSSTSPAGVTTTATPVAAPEPSALVGVLTGAGLLFMWRARKYAR